LKPKAAGNSFHVKTPSSNETFDQEFYRYKVIWVSLR
jgi:hypothetical protein